MTLETESTIVPEFPEFRWRTFRITENWTSGGGRLWYAWLILALALGFVAIFASNTALYGGCEAGSGPGIQCPDALSAGLRFGAIYLGIFVAVCIATPFVAGARKTRVWIRRQTVERLFNASGKQEGARAVADRLTDPKGAELRLLDTAHALVVLAGILVAVIMALLLLASDNFSENGGFFLEATREGLFAQLYLYNALLLAAVTWKVAGAARHLRRRAKDLHDDLQADLRRLLVPIASQEEPERPVTFQPWASKPVRRSPEKE